MRFLSGAIAFLLPLHLLASSDESSLSLRIIHITDVYTLEYFPSLKNLISEKQQDGITTISLLSGDFLMPYLLSSVDGGRGMMNMINAIPINYLTWGNHENDLPHSDLMEREKEFLGTWLNTNMQSHESFLDSTCQKDYDTIEIENGDFARKIALLGILSNAPSLYSPGAFNGATIEDPWATIEEYVDQLENEVDLILPICHLYETQDERTATEFEFPLILGGHDHHPVDRTINGTLLLKPGVDAEFARVIDIRWDNAEADQPAIEHELIRVADYAPDPDLELLVEEAYLALDHLRGTQLGFIPDDFRPLSSKGSREKRVSVATFLAGQICAAFHNQCDASIFKGSNIRGGLDYGEHDEFTLEMLQSELADINIYITELPGSVLRVGLRETWDGPNTGWFQYDHGVEVDEDGFVVSVGGEPLDEKTMYRIATTEDFFRVRDGPTIGNYYKRNPDKVPGEGVSVYDLLLRHTAEGLWSFLSKTFNTNSSGNSSGLLDQGEFLRLDINGNGELDREDVMHALSEVASLKTYNGEYSLVDHILASAAGRSNASSSAVSLHELNIARSAKFHEAPEL